MAIYIMNGKSFQKTFVKKEDPDKILKARYVVVSSRIRNVDSTIANVQKANRLLFPSNELLADVAYLDDDFFAKEYYRQLKDAKTFLSTIVLNAITKQKTFIFLCSETEWSIGYLQTMAKFIEKEFHYPVYNYMRYKKGKESVRPYDKDDVLKRCRKQQQVERNRELHYAIHSKKDQKQMLKKLTEKEMKRILQNIDCYAKDMSRKQMKWMIKNYLFD